MLKITAQDITASLSVSFLTIAAGAALGEWAGIGASAGIVSMGCAALVGSFFGGIPVKVSGLTATTGALYLGALQTTSLNQESIVWAMLFASVLLLLVGFFRPSRIMAYIPNAVIAGFMNGIALLLIYEQLQKMIGPKWALTTESYFAIGAAITLLLWRRIAALPSLGSVGNYVSGSLIVMALGGLLQYLFQFAIPTLSVQLSSLSSLVNIPEIPAGLGAWADILIQGVFISFIVLVATLITARALDPTALLDADVKNQSVANAVSGLVGGFPTTIGYIRTTVLKRNGASSSIVGALVGMWTLLVVLVFSSLLSYIPTSVFVGILFVAGYRALDITIFKELRHTHNHYVALAIFLLATYLTFIGELAAAVIAGSLLWQLCGRIPKLRLPDLAGHKHGIDIQ